MYGNQNKHYAINVFQSVMAEKIYFVSRLHIWEKVEEIRIGFPLGMFVLLRRHRNSS